MFPSSGVVPYAALHLLICGAVLVFAARSVARAPSLGRAVLWIAGVAVLGGILSLLTAPRAPGGYPFAVLLAWAWTLGLVVPTASMMMAGVLVARRRRLGWVFVAAAGIGAGMVVDAFWVEPRQLEISVHRIETAKVAEPLRIVLFADVQTDRPGAHERRAFARAMDLRPDLVLFAGDFVQAYGDRYALAWGELAEIAAVRAPLGVIGTQGDVDRPGWETHASATGIDVLHGSRRLREDVWLTGLDLRASARPATVAAPGNRFHIVLGHRPDYALGDVEADLLLAGHTHGGQVQLPFLGPVFTASRVPRSWAAGRTEIRDDTTLIVSRGLGMERGVAPRMRFLCRPEIVVIDVVPSRD